MVVERVGPPTSGVDDEAAGVPADKEAPALHAEPCDLALLQDVLQAAEVLYAPDEGGLVAVRCARAQRFAACFGLRPYNPPGRLHPTHCIETVHCAWKLCYLLLELHHSR